MSSPESVVYLGDCLDVMRGMPDNSVDAVVTDPPYGLSKEPDIIEVLTHWMRGDDYAHRGGGFMGKCLHPDTDLLTRRGWVPVSLVMEGDEVYSLAPDGRAEYVPVVARHEYEFDGELLSVGGRSSRQVVTPNHMVWTDKGLIRADAIPRKFRVYNQASPIVGSRPDTVIIEGGVFPTLALMRFLGLWLGDGYVAHRVNQPWKQDFLGVGVQKPRKDADWIAALDALGVRYTRTVCGDGKFSFYIYDKHLLAWLSPLRGAHNKAVPVECWGLDASMLEGLYSGLVDSDGCVQGAKGQHVYYTVSETLADDFQRLCLLTGRSAVRTWRDRVTAFGGSGSYALSVVQPRQGYWMERDGRTDRPQPAGVQPVPYIGKVHCVTIDRHHVMMSRYDGRPAWTGNSWDSFVPGPSVWKECFRILRPGGHLLSFGGSRTYDLVTLAIRMSGFEIRDSIMWCYGSGFPKSLDVSKAIDKAAGAVRTVKVGERGLSSWTTDSPGGAAMKDDGGIRQDFDKVNTLLAPATADAERWSGWGTALKPAMEPIVVARKPFAKGATVAANVLEHGTGALNIDACRVAGEPVPINRLEKWSGFGQGKCPNYEQFVKKDGRWPANVVLSHAEGCEQVGTRRVKTGTAVNRNRSGNDQRERSSYGFDQDERRQDQSYGEDGTETISAFECAEGCPVVELDQQSGVRKSSGVYDGDGSRDSGLHSTDFGGGHRPASMYADSGGASRFFPNLQDAAPFIYMPKAGKKERPVVNGVAHPTVKPVALMQWLVRLVTPPGGVVLDPYLGSGTTVQAAVKEGFSCIGIENEPTYIPLVQARLGDVAFRVVESPPVDDAAPIPLVEDALALVEDLTPVVDDVALIQEPISVREPFVIPANTLMNFD